MSLEARGVSHSYPNTGFAVLRDLALTINPGDSMAIVGPSGSGKTTLISILGLLMAPTRGELLLNGLHVRSGTHKGHSQSFSWVFQASAKLDSRTTLDNVCLPLFAQRWRRSSAIDAGRSALDRVGLLEAANTPSKHLSGGEARKMEVARALIGRPEYLFADEPTASLDHKNSMQLADTIWSLRERTTAIVIATHDLELAGRCDRIVAIRDGELADLEV